MTSKAFGLAQLGNAYADGALSNRNMIYNGQAAVNQRGTQTGASSNTYFVDRWELATVGGTAVFDLKQSTDVPTGQGFATSLQIDVTTADTAMGAGDGYFLRQQFEGQDLQRIAKGTSNAQPMTLQFWVKSPKTGTHIVDLYDFDNTRSVGAAYTISAANTWEHKTIVIPADTSGPFDNDNQRSLAIQWWLAAGSDFTSGTLETSWAAAVSANRVVGQVNCVDDAANNFYLTGVQLEAGDTATPFEHRSYGQELALCQRYCFDVSAGKTSGFVICNLNAGEAVAQIDLPVRMRATPTLSPTGVTGYGGGATEYRVYQFNQSGGGFNSAPVSPNIVLSFSSPQNVWLVAYQSASWANPTTFDVTGGGLDIGSSVKILLSAEL